MPSKLPVILLFLFFITGAIHSAHKGIQAIVSTTVLVFFLIGLSLIFIVFSLFNKVDPENYLPFMRSGINEDKEGAIYIISRNFGLPIIAIILPYLEGNKIKTYSYLEFCYTPFFINYHLNSSWSFGLLFGDTIISCIFCYANSRNRSFQAS